MLRITFEEVPEPSFADLFRLFEAPTFEAVVRVFLAAPKATGPVGEGINSALKEAVQTFGKDAAAKLLEHLPPKVANLMAEEDGGISPHYGIWLTDGQNNFAGIFEGREALLGSGPEFAQAFANTLQSVARRMAADPEMSAEARYNAALMLERPKLAAVR